MERIIVHRIGVVCRVQRQRMPIFRHTNELEQEEEDDRK